MTDEQLEEPTNTTKSKMRSSLESLFRAWCALGLLFGLIHTLAFIKNQSNMISLGDAFINSLFGIFAYANYRLISMGKQNAIYLTAMTVAIGLMYGFIVGRGLNIFILLFGGFILAETIILWRRGEIN